ncbi:MAG: M23 family metallopeptidase [Burkholderiales bacterium]|nr:M23 family metallopeptidase [Burkholderiales bacterium]
MNIILVSSRRATAKTITLGRSHVLGGCMVLVLALFALAALMNYAALRYAAQARDSALLSLFSEAAREDGERTQAYYVRDNLDAMATRLGELQAQILRLDTLGERVARLAGFKPQELQLDQSAARGGALTTRPAEPLSFTELARRLDFLAHQVDDRSDRLGLLDSLLTLDNVKKQLLPSVLPLRIGTFTSDFGWRLDPFKGERAFHEGVDFMAKSGTLIVAAAAGVVVASEYHPQYGNMIEVDHGNGLVTRYAHCSRRLVDVGAVVMKGATIGEVGSSGRATGPHLHFEVRHNGVAQNPARFLRTAG